MNTSGSTNRRMSDARLAELAGAYWPDGAAVFGDEIASALKELQQRRLAPEPAPATNKELMRLSAENTALRNLANNLQPGPISAALGGVENEKPFRLAAGFVEVKQPSEPRGKCPTCNGTGRQFVGHSGRDDDGNAPEFVRCEECGYGDEPVAVLRGALRIIAAGPPSKMENSEVAAWAGWVASKALAGIAETKPAPAGEPREQHADDCPMRFAPYPTECNCATQADEPQENELYRLLVVRGYAQHEASCIADGPRPADDLALFALSVLTNLSDATPATHPTTFKTAQEYADAWRTRQPSTKVEKP